VEGRTDFNTYSPGFLFCLQVWLHMNDELEDGGNKSYSLLQYDHRDTSVSVTFSSYEIRDILNY